MRSDKPLVTMVSAAMLLIFTLIPFVVPCANPAPQQPIELRISTWGGPKHYMSVGYWDSLFMPKVEKSSGGRVKCTLYAGGVLGKAEDHYNMAVTGVADITWSLIGYTVGRFPLVEVIELPFIASEDGVVNSRILWQLYEEFSEIRRSFADTHMILLYALPPSTFHSAKLDFNSIDDFRGRKIRGYSQAMARIVESVGGRSLFMSMGELYMAAQTGVVDAWIASPGTLKGFKMADVCRYVYLPGWASSGFFVTMNLDKWNSLPKDVQKMITDELGGMAGAKLCGLLGIQDQQDGVAHAEQLGTRVINWSPEMVAKLKEAAKPVHEKWIADMEAKGLPGRKVYNRTVELVEKYSK